MKSKSLLFTTAILTVLSVGCAKKPVIPPKTVPNVVNTIPNAVTKVPNTATKVPIENAAVAFEKAISNTGESIISLTKNLTVDKDFIVNGEFKNAKNIIERRINLYSQDKEKKITSRYILAVPKLVINSPNTSIEHGTFKGDLYISSMNFQLIDTVVDGNIYFTTDEAKSTFKMDSKSMITGKQELITATNTTSMVSTAAAFEKAISNKGTLSIALTKNLTIDKNLVVDGEFKTDKNIIERKIDLYSQDKAKNITSRFTLTVPKLTINSPQTSIEHGIFKGDLYVSSNNFKLMDTVVEGNLYFTTPEAKSTFKMDTKSKVTGKQEFRTQMKTTPNVGNTVSMVSTAAAFENAISSKGTWIISITKDLTIDKNLLVDGEYKNGKKDASGKDIIERKIDLYTQDEEKNINAKYTLTVPKLTINSPETCIEHGTFKGDLYVSSKNFKLVDAKVEGNVYFTTDEAKSTFKMDAKSIVTGKQELRK